MIEIVIGILVLLAIVFVLLYNNLIVLKNNVENAWAQVDVQLKRRSDLIPNLVNSVKGYMKHEKETLENITNARAALMSAKTPREAAQADNMLSGALKSLFAVAENYPNLKASENFKLLQEQLEGVENMVAYSRQFYNDSVLEFNNLITTFPGNLFAGGRTPREYFEATESERAPVKVEF